MKNTNRFARVANNNKNEDFSNSNNNNTNNNNNRNRRRNQNSTNRENQIIPTTTKSQIWVARDVRKNPPFVVAIAIMMTTAQMLNVKLV